MTFTVVYHRHPIIRSASPIFILISLFGVLLLFASVIALVAPVTASSCDALSWMVNLGITVTFAPLFAKTWRIYRIFGQRKINVVKVSNRRLMIIIGVLLVAELVMLSLWQGLSPLQPYVTSTNEGSPASVHEYNQCGFQGTGTTLFVIAGLEKGVLLVFGALMAFSTRKVSHSFNESNQIALAIYNVVFSIGIIAPILAVIGAMGDAPTPGVLRHLDSTDEKGETGLVNTQRILAFTQPQPTFSERE